MQPRQSFYSFCISAITVFTCFTAHAQSVKGFYRYPTLSQDKIIFAAEGDLWVVATSGGIAQRLTTHPGEETYPVVSPDGKTLAFTATYEGEPEVYTMPLAGGLPKRWTYESEPSESVAWINNNELVYSTTHFSTLPQRQLIKINVNTLDRSPIELEVASEGTFDQTGKTVYFVRPAFHNNVTKRYKGGTARQVWKYTMGSPEAIKLTTDHEGEAHHPMWWNGRVYFVTDRDGIMNIWSMTDDGKDFRQHTRQQVFDIKYASLSGGKIVYQRGADIWLFDIATNQEKLIDIALVTDLDQQRERWVQNPQQYLTSFHFDAKGENIVLTARGRIFLAPVNSGRFVQVSRKQGVRYRDARFMADGKDVITLSDESGEFELVKIPATGVGKHTALTTDGKILRFNPMPSPDSKWIAYNDNNNDLWLYNTTTKAQKKLSTNREGVGSYSWSPDSKWIAFEQTADNTFSQIHLYDVTTELYVALTSDRANSTSPVWSADGEWIYFLSDRNFQSLVGAPWGSRQPEPYFDKQDKIYHIALKKGLTSPFKPVNELYSGASKKETSTPPVVSVDKEGIQQRIQEVPLPAGNYSRLAINDKAIYYMAATTGLDAKRALMCLKISNEEPKPASLVEDIASFELSGNGKKILIRKEKDFYAVEAGTSSISKLNEARVDMKNWSFSINPKEDWKQLFTDAWRMERDYFYDPNMHGVDWNAKYKLYATLLDRITTRNELSDLIGEYVGELEALHTSVRGGDLRVGEDRIDLPTLGAKLSRSATLGGFRVDYIYRTDPDYPNKLSPLAEPGLNVSVGDIITHINGVETLTEVDANALLRNQSNNMVRLTVKSGSTVRDVLVKPIRDEGDLRYSDWEYSRRLQTESLSANKIGYVHLRAMGGDDLNDWYREFYPAFNRQGLIIDCRSNRGGNIDSFILEKLLRKAWHYWKGRAREPYWNMQYAFRGHIVCLVDERTASDGEDFAEGFRRLGLGKVIGTRTWGGEIWLSGVNTLSDNGIARTPMNGVYGPEGKWLIENRGVEPDIEVLNAPHETFLGKDAQLEAAVKHLMDLIKADPREVPAPPAYPIKGK